MIASEVRSKSRRRVTVVSWAVVALLALVLVVPAAQAASNSGYGGGGTLGEGAGGGGGGSPEAQLVSTGESNASEQAETLAFTGHNLILAIAVGAAAIGAGFGVNLVARRSAGS